MNAPDINRYQDTSAKRLRVQELYYLDRLRDLGTDTAWSVGWPEYLQVLLFDKFINILSKGTGKTTLLDVGCGLGDLAHYLYLYGLYSVRYYGIDILPEMIRAARRKYPAAIFENVDFFSPAFSRRFDYIFCSGALNIRTEKTYNEYTLFVMRFIKKMYDLSDRGCGINLLASEGKEYFPDDKSFYYADRKEITEFCRSLSDKVKIDYNEHEYIFTLLIEK